MLTQEIKQGGRMAQQKDKSIRVNLAGWDFSNLKFPQNLPQIKSFNPNDWDFSNMRAYDNTKEYIKRREEKANEF